MKCDEIIAMAVSAGIIEHDLDDHAIVEGIGRLIEMVAAKAAAAEREACAQVAESIGGYSDAWEVARAIRQRGIA